MAKVVVAIFVALLGLIVVNGERRGEFTRFPVVSSDINTRHRPFLTPPEYVANGENHRSLRTERQSMCSRTDLRQRLASLQCDADYLSAIREVEGIECSFLITSGVASMSLSSLTLQDRDFSLCGSDRNGTFCGVHDSSSDNPRSEARNVIRACLEDTEDTRNCSDACKTELQNFADTFGCCVHSNDVKDSDFALRALAPQLWEDCGVTLPAPCDNAPDELAPLSREASCSYTCSLNQLQALFCKYQAATAIQIYQECDEEQSALQVEQSCSFNDEGEFCATVGSVNFPFFLFTNPRDELDDDYFLDVYSKCVSFSSTGNCPAECREVLLEAKEKFGCCFNNVNRTDFPVNVDGLRSFVTSYDLWTACVVEPPGFCEFPQDASVFDELTQCSVCELQAQSTDDHTNFPILAVAVSSAVVVLLLIAALIITVGVCYYYKRKVPSGQKNGSPAENITAINTAPDHTDDDIAGQPVDNGVGTSVYYDYIPPLDPAPNSQLPQSSSAPSYTTDTAEMNSNYSMTENYSYNRVPYSSNKTTHSNASNPQTLPCPPLPPRNAHRGIEGSESIDLETEDSEGYMKMLPNLANTPPDVLPATDRNLSVECEETVDYI